MTFDLTEEEHTFVINAIVLALSEIIPGGGRYRQKFIDLVSKAYDDGVVDATLSKIDSKDWASAKGQNAN